MGATWLGGVATYTTARDRFTKMVYCSSTTIAGCFSLGTLGSGVCFLVIYSFIGMLGYHVQMMISLFDTFPYYDVQHMIK